MLTYIEKCAKSQKEIKVIGIPDGWTPYDLSIHYIELYNILEESKRHPKELLGQWLDNAQTRKVQDFTTQREIEILQEIIKND